jgi:hypothetical protein
MFHHLKEAQMTYCEHFVQAMWMVGELSLSIGALMVHAVYPDLFPTYASNRMKMILETKKG